MPTYEFEAMDATGQEIKDVVEAPNEEEAQATIRQMGYFVTKISEKKARAGLAARRKSTRVSSIEGSIPHMERSGNRGMVQVIHCFRTSTLSRLERSGSRIEGCGQCDESWQARILRYALRFAPRYSGCLLESLSATCRAWLVHISAVSAYSAVKFKMVGPSRRRRASRRSTGRRH